MPNSPPPAPATPPAGTARPVSVSVGVVVDLEWIRHAGGHVKCWERFAEAAVQVPEAVDLTVYLLGPEGTHPLSDTVRFVTVPAAFGTRRLPFVRTGTGETDIARVNRRLARRLSGHDVLHATHSFAPSRTARRVAEARGLPLVSSIHTDLAVFTPVYTRASVESLLGANRISRGLIDGLDLPGRATRGVLAREARILTASRAVLASNEADMTRAAALVGPQRVHRLRRGIDRRRFNPAARDRDRLARTFGVPVDRPVVLFAGRVDATKGAALAAEAVGRVVARGHPAHFLVAGAGAEAEAIAGRLGPDATLAGPVDQETLAWVMASADIFLFPSFSEVLGNVVLEAKAAGMAVVVADHAGPGQNIARPGTDGLLVGSTDPKDWAAALEALLADPARRQAMGRAARDDVDGRTADWVDVLKQDLLPVWRRVAGLPDA
jgi:glycosyltransferase involved in cell wall biosynthesis